MISCKRASELTEKKSVSTLGLLDRSRLRYHSKLCKACLKYQVQSKVIDQALEQIQLVNQRDQLQLSSMKKKQIIDACEGK